MKWPRKALAFTALGCLYPILWIILTFVLTAVLSPPVEPKWDWEAKLNPQVPSDMMYLMFPVAANVPRYDKPSGTPIGILDRGMTNTHAELSQSWIQLSGLSGPEWVRREDIVFDALPDTEEFYVNEASRALARRLDNDFASIHLRHKITTSGATEYTLTIRPDDDHVEKYVYLVANGVATPVKMRKYFGPGEALSRLDSLPVAALISAGILAFPLGIWAIIAWRKRCRASLTAQ